MPRRQATPEVKASRAIDKLEAIVVCWQNGIPVPDKLKLSAPELAIVRGFLAGKQP